MPSRIGPSQPEGRIDLAELCAWSAALSRSKRIALAVLGCLGLDPNACTLASQLRYPLSWRNVDVVASHVPLDTAEAGPDAVEEIAEGIKRIIRRQEADQWD